MLAGVILALGVSSVSAASLQFDPTTKSTSKNENFEIKLDIDAGTNEILAADVKVTYDQALLEVVKIDNGTYFPTIGKSEFEEIQGKIYWEGIVNDPGDFKTGTGTLATVTFKALADGTATIKYICTPGETGDDSNIANNDFDATDVINCSENGTSRVTIGTGTSTITPTITSDLTVTPEPSITSLPETGMFDSSTGASMLLPISILMVLIGVAVKILLR